MYTSYSTYWILFSIALLSLSIFLGIKYKKDLYRIVGLNLLIFYFTPQLFYFYNYTPSETKNEYELTPIGTISKVKGILNFNELRLKNTIIYYIIPFDSLGDNKIERYDSTRFTLTIPSKNKNNGYGKVMFVKAPKEELRKLKDLYFIELEEESNQIQITFIGKKLDEYLWECQNILKIEKIEGRPIAISH